MSRRLLTRGIPCAIVLAAAFYALVALVAGCRANPSPPSGLPIGGELATLEEAFAAPPPATLRALAAEVGLVDEAPAVGAVRRLRGVKTACQPRSRTGLPYLWPAGRPIVGQPWRCRLATTPMRPEPDFPMWLVISTQPPGRGLPAELTPVGMPGCWLQINPELIVPVVAAAPPQPAVDAAVPTAPVEPDPAAPRLERAVGRGSALLTWTPPAGSVGHRLWLQLLVAAPGSTPSGFMTSFAIELQVGNQ